MEDPALHNEPHKSYKPCRSSGATTAHLLGKEVDGVLDGRGVQQDGGNVPK